MKSSLRSWSRRLCGTTLLATVLGAVLAAVLATVLGTALGTTAALAQTVAAPSVQAAAAPAATSGFRVRPVDDAWRAALPRDAAAATQAYLDRLPADVVLRSNE